MTRRTGWPLVLVLLGTLWFISPVPAQQMREHAPGDTTAQVRALTDFHGVIFKIWHTAWPAKNTAMLRELLPEVERRADSVRHASLPGILRDKQKAWDENVEQLLIVVKEYKDASSPVDSQKLLDAAEKLHAQYEKLVRVTRPVLKELDEFHHVLYMLYHHYLPENNQEMLVSSIAELKGKMVLLESAKLTGRLKNREAAFMEGRAKLARSVAALNALEAKTDRKQFASNVETMHRDYQTLEEVFE